MKVFKTVSSRLVKKCDEFEQYWRELCLRIFNVDGDDSETSNDLLNEYKELCKNLELDVTKGCIDRAGRIGKKTSDRFRPINVYFRTWYHRTIVYRTQKDCFNSRITLDLTKTLMDILKDAIDLARESDHNSYALAYHMCVKLSTVLFKFFNTIDDLNNL